MNSILFIQGGGIGYDQEKAVSRILAAAGLDWDWRVYEAGQAAIDQGKVPLSEDLLQAIRQTGIALKTKIIKPKQGDIPNLNVKLRRELGLYVSERPLCSLPGLPARYENIDILLLREITEDLYAAAEHEIIPGVVQSLKIVTESACKRFFHFAFQCAQKQGRKSVHCIHKANILKLSDGLFLDCFREVARAYPEIEPKEMIVDNGCMQMVAKPSQFEVIAAGNLYGDLLSDLGAGLIGGISATAGINHGESIRVYEALYGGDYDTVAPNHANPLPLLFPALALLKVVGHKEMANRIRPAVIQVLKDRRCLTPDLSGTATTTEMTEAIVQALETTE